MKIGSEGTNVDLVIPHGCSLSFTVEQEGEGSQTIDHSQSSARMAIVGPHCFKMDLSGCCSCTGQGIAIVIPSSVTKKLKLGDYSWDLVVTTNLGEVTRLAYGSVYITQTYALDNR